MEALDQIKARIEAAVPGAKVDIAVNPGPSQTIVAFSRQRTRAGSCEIFARRSGAAPGFLFQCDRRRLAGPDAEENVKTRTVVDGVEKEVVKTTEEKIPGYLEAVYHLYSIARKFSTANPSSRHGPVIIRMRTSDRAAGAGLPSLTPIWRSAEFQEREIFDLYGIVFDGHPDLRRILMWDEFKDHPMRKDYVEPDDYEYEPTPHDEVLERAKQHYTPRPQLDGAEQITATDSHMMTSQMRKRFRLRKCKSVFIRGPSDLAKRT